VKRIRVITRENHQIAEDTKECVAILNKGRIGAHEGKREQTFGIIWIHEDNDYDRALTLLRACGLPVGEDSRAFGVYTKSN
jgi:hypothetical protein